ncbi:TonB-dependent receptor [Sphingopyxis sp. YF1]|uniref:TonB-dependent receptor n=1 Tax=Sphingopyxis sp. YF1 TaxID=2482763 RepID=UPI001F61AD6C|nr:TonB-dependent receptor [Sphingopyxis sp. YF1]UNU43006.1 TonB-dependent receptor [Sphingopyxis sp. YF1]
MKNMKLILRAGIAAAGLIVAMPAFAQEADAAADAGADAASSGIEDIVVTARKRAESVQDVPVAITAMSGDQMVDRSVKDITDIAASTPSFFAQTSSADPAALLVSMRGQSATDALMTLDSPVGVYVDGVYLPRSIGLRAAMVDIERVEVLRGPQGTLFGKNTTGGAVSITTRQPDLLETGGFVSMILGERGKMEATGALNVPLVRDVLAVRAVVQYSGNNGYGRNLLGQRIGGDVTKTGRLNVAFAPSDRLRVNLSADYQRIKGDGIITRLSWLNPIGGAAPLPAPTNLLRATLAQQGLADTPANRATAYAFLQQALLGNGTGSFYDAPTTSPQSNEYEGYGVSGTIEYDVSDYLSVKSITANRWADRDSYVDFDGTPMVLFEPHYVTQSKVFSQELQLLSDPAERLSWILGGYYSKETGNEFTVSRTLPPILPTNPGISDGDVTNKSVAVFGQANYRVSDAVRVTAGLRWTEETKSLLTRNRNALGCNIPTSIRINGACEGYLSDTYSDWSYLVSLDWTPGSGTLFYARTSRGFKGGGQNLRGQASDPRTFNPFRPETVTDYEVGAKLDLFDRRLRMNLAGYHAIYEDIQRSTSIQPPVGSATTLITNAAKAKINGIEAEITAQPTDRLTLNVNSSYTDAGYSRFIDPILGDRSDERFPVPRWTLATNLTYELPTSLGDLKFIAGWNWRSATSLRPAALVQSSVTQKAYGLVDTRISLHVDAIDADVAVFAKNLFDKKYIVGAVDLDRTLGYNIVNVGTPRLIGVEFRKSFGSR